MTAKFRSKNIADPARASRGDARLTGAVTAALAAVLLAAVPHGQGRAPSPSPPAPAATPARTPAPAVPAAAGVAAPPDYLIGADDVLSIVYWKDKDMSTDVTVRPDGRISLPLLDDVQAAGLTTMQLRDRLMEASQRYIEDPNVTVVVHQINSRKVFITGEVAKAGPYPLGGPMSVLQLITSAGGLRDYADAKHIIILRTENGRPVSYRFNYKDVASGKNLRQNIELKPGDSVIVP